MIELLTKESVLNKLNNLGFYEAYKAVKKLTPVKLAEEMSRENQDLRNENEVLREQVKKQEVALVDITKRLDAIRMMANINYIKSK